MIPYVKCYAGYTMNIMNRIQMWFKRWIERQSADTERKLSFDFQFGGFCFIFFFFFFGTSAFFRLTHVNGALATFWRPVLSISWIITGPQLKFISLRLFNRLTNHYYYDNKYGQQNQYTTNSHGHHRTVTHICNLMWRRYCNYYLYLLLCILVQNIFCFLFCFSLKL